MTSSAISPRSPWWWIPSLYLGQGIPYVVVMSLSVVLYKNLDISNAQIALFTSGLYLPWVLKPLWAPLVDVIGTKRGWVVTMQAVVALCLGGVALALPLPGMLGWTLAVFWLLAVASATHDIAADGFYLLALSQRQQAAFVGVRSSFYRLAMIAGQGLLVVLAGTLAQRLGGPVPAWQWVFGLLALVFLGLAAWHAWALPRPPQDRPVRGGQGTLADLRASFGAFFRRPDLVQVLAFLLTFRLGEAQGLKLVSPFLLDPVARGGLGLSTADVGWVYGTLGVGALTVGGLLGGWVISRHGLRAWLWPMLLAVHLPNLAFVALATWQPQSLAVITAAIAVEQLGYGFGFAAYLLYMILVADGPHKTSHYALCTGFMALGMMLPGMVSGWIQSQIGYPAFFAWVCLCTLPSMWVARGLVIPADFGRREEGPETPPSEAGADEASTPRRG